MPAKKKVVAEKTVTDEKIYKCLCCGKEHENPISRFFKSPSKLFAYNDGYYPVCRQCLNDRFNDYKARYGERQAVVIMCHYLDMPFYYSLYDSIIKSCDNFTIGMYLRQMNNRQYYSKTFVTTLIEKRELGIDEEKFDDIKEEKWTLSETKTKNNVIDIVGYDPFEGYNEQQRKFLFNNIIGYLGDDGIEDDTFKISQIVQIVNNNYQIEQLNKAINKCDPQVHMSDLKDMNDLKKKLVESNDKIAKENGISVKNRLDRQAGRSTLTYLMKHLRELDIPAAEANYYDQLKSEGTQWAANVSLKAIKENGFFDENDHKDMLETQYKLIQELQSKLDDIIEENRLLLIENDELKDRAGGK